LLPGRATAALIAIATEVCPLLDSVVSALSIVFDAARFAIICFGESRGLMIGVIPGVGGLAGGALLIPAAWPPAARLNAPDKIHDIAEDLSRSRRC
jgi:hypothetical protein